MTEPCMAARTYCESHNDGQSYTVTFACGGSRAQVEGPYDKLPEHCQRPKGHEPGEQKEEK